MATLDDFPRPSVTVDVAVCTVVDDRLCVVVWRRTGNTEPGRWALPGSFVQERERLDHAVARTLADKCGIVGLAPTQLRVMDEPRRDDRGWVLSVAHLDVVAPEAILQRTEDASVRLAPVRADPADDSGPPLDLPGRQRRLPFDHDEIVALAVATLRGRYAALPDPAGLAGERFTMRRLRRLHEAIAGRALQKDTFRREMLPYLVETAEIERGNVGRPAVLFRHR